MISEAQRIAIDLSIELQDHTPATRRELFRELASTFCFTCGEERSPEGDCPCLIDKRAEVEQQQDQLPS